MRTMKKIILAAMALVMVASVGCQKDDSATISSKVKVNFTVADKPSFDNSTRAVKSGWENGDEILIAFKGESGLLDITNGANTLKLKYNGTAWVADTSKMPASGLVSGNGYIAIYHHGTITLGAKHDTYKRYAITGYKGGERLSYTGTYSISESPSEVVLGTINMQRYVNDFQVSVRGLTGDNWKMSIFADDQGSTTGVNIQHTGTNTLYLNESDSGTLGFTGYFPPKDAAGVEYGGDVSFYFTKVSLSATQLVFKLSNGIDTYLYTKTGVTYTTLEGGKAYYLPAITDAKWVKQVAVP